MARIVKELPPLAAERALRIISGRWKVNILYYLLESPRRLSELRRSMPGASQKVLVQQLRELEAHRIVKRRVFAEVPARVEYSLSPLGRSLGTVVGALCKWGTRHQATLDAIDSVSRSQNNGSPSQNDGPHVRLATETGRSGSVLPRKRSIA
jgi:DNA-binding HxlR family transcriptional regulator